MEQGGVPNGKLEPRGKEVAHLLFQFNFFPFCNRNEHKTFMCNDYLRERITEGEITQTLPTQEFPLKRNVESDKNRALVAQGTVPVR